MAVPLSKKTRPATARASKERRRKMSTLTTAIRSKRIKNQCLQNGHAKEEGLKRSEIGWLCFNFVLFLALGPFSVLAVLPALFSLAPQDEPQMP